MDRQANGLQTSLLFQMLPLRRVIFFCSLSLLVLSGVLVVIINTYSQVNDQQHSLNKGLWKFVTNDYLLHRKKQRIWACRKLTIAGFMIANVFISTLSRVLSIEYLLGLPMLFFIVWWGLILYYWYAYLQYDDDSTVSKTAEKSIDERSNFGWEYKSMDRSTMKDNRLPVTIVTGYLGSGKTTLVKGLLSNTTGMRVLVIENEIGAEGIDHDLLMQHTGQEEIVLMNNGCICCTVRSDLLKTFHRLFESDSFARLDWVVIETTGLADPAPLIQSLYMDDKCRDHLRMDSVVTVVDCKHFPAHLQQQTHAPIVKDKRQFMKAAPPALVGGRPGAHGGVSEAVLQVTFADRVILNKTDLVAEDEVQRLSLLIADINPAAGIIACQHGAVPITDLLNIRAFDPLRNRAMLDLQCSSSDVHAVPERPILIQRDAQGKILRKTVQVDFGSSSTRSRAAAGSIERRGGSAVGDDSGGGGGVSGISTVSLTTEDPLDLQLFNVWISRLLGDKGADLYRSKGILSMAGHEEQFVLQCVHMIFDGERGPRWPLTGPRRSRLVFIGLNLDREALLQQFLACRLRPTG